MDGAVRILEPEPGGGTRQVDVRETSDGDVRQVVVLAPDDSNDIISPATSGLQSAANTKLDTLADRIGVPSSDSVLSVLRDVRTAAQAFNTNTDTVEALLGTLVTQTLTPNISDRSGRLLGHVTIDNATLLVETSTTPLSSITRDAAGRITGYTELGHAYTVARDSAGRVTGVS